MRGRIKDFNSERGFGFIEVENGPDVFVDFKNMAPDAFKTISEGDEVEFDLTTGLKGPFASNVVKL
ncbi:cold shock domain-containing protein [Streptomyces subrutilus]|uniref:cold-shock protein n=1 Tax=Streptomyces subrutilus TaxID=36818 RepID=UPI002E14D023|nr:cold shock domain-containing protein [Streptomyces subrutilus]